jgi:putative membrane-bound dehydrogenase-like protein
MSDAHKSGKKWRSPCSAALMVAASFCIACAGWSAEAKHETNALPRVAAFPATNAPATFRVKPGFRLELVAGYPLVASPVAMAFDENNRLFVVERPDDSDPRGTNTHSGRIRLLEDTEGTGEFHASTIYADNLPWASAVACYGGGVHVAAGRELLFLKDTKTNGIADVRKVVFTGFGGTNTLEAEALPNNFNWGMDNHLHAANSGMASAASPSNAPGPEPALLTGGDFSFDPRTLTIALEAGPAQSGLTFDNRGRKFICEPTRPLRTPMYEPRYVERNPFFPAPPEMVEVASPATAIFRFVTNAAPQPASGRPTSTNELARALARMTTVLAPTWLTNAQGCVVYRGNAFPSTYFGNVFIADPSAHVIHRAVLREAGLDVVAIRAPDETASEFVASSDAAFRPVQIVNGPDGALYVADRQGDRKGGRIYRIVPANFKPPKPPRLGKASTYDLVAMLSHPNGWQRDTAARLLYDRRNPAAATLLGNVLDNSRVPLARLHALHVLDGLGALKEAHALKALRDPDERVREHAVLLTEKLVKGGVLADTLWAQLRLLAADPSVRVRHQLALTVGEIRRPDKAQVLTGIVWRDPENLWLHTAILSSLADGAGDLFVSLAGDARVRGSLVGQDWLRRLSTMIGVKGQPAEVAQVLAFLDETRMDPQQAFALLYALGDGLYRARSSLALMDPQSRLQRVYSQALDGLQNYAIPELLRVEEIRLLGVAPNNFANTGDLLLLQLGGGQSEAIQSTAIATLGRYDDPRIAPALIQRWGVLTPRLRCEAVTALLAQNDRNGAVLTALESGRIAGTDLSSAQVDFLRMHRDPAISRRALQLFGPVPWQRPEAVQRFKPALGLQGAADRGRGIFLARCVACHPPDHEVQALGPELVSARIYGKEKLLMAILEPNSDVRRDYPTCVGETPEGEALIGILRNENAAAITLQQLNGVAVVLPRARIQYLQAQPWSIMPEGLEEGLTPQDMADLLSYILRPTTTP